MKLHSYFSYSYYPFSYPVMDKLQKHKMIEATGFAEK
jgi:hypothetical protein